MRMTKRAKRGLAFMSLALVLACGGDKGDDNNDNGTDDDGEAPYTSGSLAIAIPNDLVIESPFNLETAQEVQTAIDEFNGQINVPATNLTQGKPPPPDNMAAAGPKGPAERRAQLGRILNAKKIEECVYREQPAGITNPNCYGTALKYRNHPDGSDQLPSNYDANDIKTYPHIGSGDLGIWRETEPTGEACVAAKMNGVIDEIGAKINNAIGFMAMVTCVARLQGGKETPSEGEELDFAEYLAKVNELAGSDNFFTATITAAKVKAVKIGDTSEVGYISELTYTKQTNDANLQGTRVFTVEFSHIAKDLQENTYVGYLKVIESTEGADTNVQCNSGQQVLDSVRQLAISVHYAKDNKNSLRYEAHTGGWLPSKTGADMFDSGNYARTPSQGDCNLGGTFTISQTDPESGIGKVASAWIAGQGGEYTRSFVADVKIDGEGDAAKKIGCGFFGFGPTMDDLLDTRFNNLPADKQLTFIDKFRCNWAGPGHSDAASNKQLVQKQCMEQDDTGKFVPTTNNIKFSPQNACQAGSGSAFEIYEQDFANNTFTKIDNIVTHELMDLSTVEAIEVKAPALPN